MKIIQADSTQCAQEQNFLNFTRLLQTMLALLLSLFVAACSSTSSKTAPSSVRGYPIPSRSPATNAVSPTRPAPNSSSSSVLTLAEKGAITAVQEYSLDGSNTVTNWLIVAMTAKKGMGDNIDLTGAYWSARENGQSTQVRFFYKEGGEWQYAEWRYVPSTGLVVGENELGRMTVR